MQEAVINYTRVAYMTQPVTGRAPERRGSGAARGVAAPSGVFRCKGDGPNDYCYIHASRGGDGGHFHRLLCTIGQEHLLADPRFANGDNRTRHAAELHAIIEEWTRQRPKREVMEILGGAGVPTGAVFDTVELHDDPFLRQRGAFTTVQHPVRGEFTMPGWPVKMSESNVAVQSAPLLGQDNATVYGELLGCTQEQLDELRAARVI
jgi:formyl-CoA transferase